MKNTTARTIAATAAALALITGPAVAHAVTTKRVSSTYAADSAPVLYLSGAIRCSGGVYSAIADSGHSPYGIASVTTASSYVRVTFTQTLSTVGDMQITPDETYVQAGISMGGSVGLSYVNILFAKDGNAISPASACLTSSNVWLNGHGHIG